MTGYRNRCGLNLFETVAAKTFSEVRHIRWVTRHRPLKFNFTGECLVIGILYPTFHHNLIAEAFKMLQNGQANHQADGLGGFAEVGIQRCKFGL